MAVDLFTRIQQHNQERGWMPDGYQDLSKRPRTQYSPATVAQVHTTESMLGFALPGQLRALLQAVGNGGFGPAYGIAGAHDGFPVAGIGGTLEQSYQDYRAGKTLVDYTHYQQEPGVFLLPHDVWSARLLPFADLGCVRTMFIDTTTGEVLRGGPISGSLYRLQKESSSLTTWLESWLAEA